MITRPHPGALFNISHHWNLIWQERRHAVVNHLRISHSGALATLLPVKCCTNIGKSSHSLGAHGRVFDVS